jgi:hypothetical protein
MFVVGGNEEKIYGGCGQGCFICKRPSPLERKNNSLGGRCKYRGKSKSTGHSIRKCWKCGKVGHYKKHCRPKNGKYNGADVFPGDDSTT